MTPSRQSPEPAPAAATPRRLVHHRGALVPAEEATLPMGSIALRYGVSVFEGVRLYRQAGPRPEVRPWLLGQHLERLRNSCRTMGLDENCCDDVPRIVDELVEANTVTEDSYVRVAVSAANAGGITDPAETALTVSVTPSGRKKWLRTGTGARLAVSDWQRPSPQVFPAAAKNISAYAGPRLAALAAQAEGFDTCLLLTAEGLVSEAPTATVFLFTDGRLVTPRLRDSVLPGVTRAWVLLTARAMGLRAGAEAVPPASLCRADEAFLCGTGMEFAPVSEVDRVPLGAWPHHPVTDALVEEYFRQARGQAPATPVVWEAAAEASPAAHGTTR